MNYIESSENSDAIQQGKHEVDTPNGILRQQADTLQQVITMPRK